jgi:hypothetical protein
MGALQSRQPQPAPPHPGAPRPKAASATVRRAALTGTVGVLLFAAVYLIAVRTGM